MKSFFDIAAESQLFEVFQQASKCCDGYESEVSVIAVSQQGTVTKHERLSHQKLKTMLESEDSSLKESHSLRVFSARASILDGQVGEDKLHVHFHSESMKLLRDHAGMTPRFISEVYNCDSWTMFPTTSYQTEGRASTSAFQYGFWVWEDGSTHSFVQVVHGEGRTTCFCLNMPKELQTRIFRAIEKAPPAASCLPLFMDMIIVDHVLASYRKAIAGYRKVLSDIERNTKSLDDTDHEAGASKLHGLSILWHTIQKDLSDIAGHIQHLRSTIPSSHKQESAIQSAYESLRSFEDSCLFWQRWVETYKERTSIRINLMHHLSSQRIAVHTQRDGVSMFTLATVTAVFLPGTFVCSILSTVFFDFDQNGVSVSSLWWVLPAIAIPLTITVLLLWFLWFRHRLSHSGVILSETEKPGVSRVERNSFPGIGHLRRKRVGDTPSVNEKS